MATPISPDPRRALVDAAADTLRRADTNGDGVIAAGKWQPEIDADTDPLARAVYDFVDYGNYTGRTSLWGPSSRGDVLTGGLGVGYTLRPRHHTSMGRVTKRALALGVADLQRRLVDGSQDRPDRDVQRIVEAGATRGLWAAGDASSLGAVHRAAEGLLSFIQSEAAAKERRLGQDRVSLTRGELLEALRAAGAPRAPELAVAEVVLDGSAPWQELYGARLRILEERRRALGLEPHDPDEVGDAAQHYLLVVSKRAREAELLRAVEEQLEARMQRERLSP